MIQRLLIGNRLTQVEMKFVIPSTIIGTRTKIEALLGLKLTRHADFLTEASNLKDE